MTCLMLGLYSEKYAQTVRLRTTRTTGFFAPPLAYAPVTYARSTAHLLPSLPFRLRASSNAIC
jgi:hypothetical protein